VPTLAYAAALLFLIVGGVRLIYQQVRRPAGTYALLLPDPRFTPGVAQPIALSAICYAANDEVVRSVPDSVQQAVFREYGISNAPASDYEVDYLITPGLGGTDNIRNLWPQPHDSNWNSYVKDELEHRLHNMVCSGQLPLSTAQQEIAANWISAYEKYFHTKKPLRSGLIAPNSTVTGLASILADFSLDRWHETPAVVANDGSSIQRASLATLLLVLLCIFGLLIDAGIQKFEELIRFATHFLADILADISLVSRCPARQGHSSPNSISERR